MSDGDQKTLVQPLNVQDALARCAGDKDFLKEMLSEFLQLSGDQMSAIQQAIGGNDADTLTKQAHSIKGAAANLGAESVASVALELEMMGRKSQLDQAGDAFDRLRQQVDALNEYVTHSLDEATKNI